MLYFSLLFPYSYDILQFNLKHDQRFHLNVYTVLTIPLNIIKDLEYQINIFICIIMICNFRISK